MKKLLLLLLVAATSAQALSVRSGGHQRSSGRHSSGSGHRSGRHSGGRHSGGRRSGSNHRRGGRHGSGHGQRHGRHHSGYRSGYGSSWLPSWLYWRTGAPAYSGPVESYNFWEITNSTPGFVTVSTDAGTYTLARGEVKRVPQTGSLRVEVRASYNGQTQIIQTSEPFLLITDDAYSGRLMIQPYSSARSRY